MKKRIMYCLTTAIILGGCYPEGPETYEDLDVVYTNYKEEFDFAGKATYSIPDKIVKITGNLAEGEDPEFVKEPFNTEILQQIQSNMSDLGWTEVNDPENADLVLFPATWTNTTVYYWYDYWCWYYPWYCGWGWGWYYPAASSYTTGTLVMTLVADGDEYIEPDQVWTGAVNGLFSGAYNSSRVENAIDQAFAQSPYLNTK